MPTKQQIPERPRPFIQFVPRTRQIRSLLEKASLQQAFHDKAGQIDRTVRVLVLLAVTQVTRIVVSAVGHRPQLRGGQRNALEDAWTAHPFHFFSAGPVYTLSGRINRLLACCSITCAHHPLIRLATKIGVYCGTGIPIV